MQTPASFKSIVLALCVVLASCGSQEGARSALTGKVGAAGEIVVVCDEAVWSGAAGDTLRAIFDQPFPVLPQYEPWFDLVHLEPESFDRFWKPHRNIIVLELADRVDTQTPEVKIFKEKYAREQLYVVGKARDAAGLAMALDARGSELLSAFHRIEVDRYAGLIGLSENEVIRDELGQKAGLQLTVPRDARWAKKSMDFLWIDRQLTRMKGGDNHDVQQGFFVYREPYTSDEQFSMQARLNKRNEVLKDHVPGPTPRSFMTTEMRYTPSYEEVVFNGGFASELRGLWRIEGDYMGGPFYSLTAYDERSGDLVTVEGYAYAPFFDKREYMREVEAIVRSLAWYEAPNAHTDAMRNAGLWLVVLAWAAVGCAPETTPTQWEFDSSIRALTVAPNGDVWWAGSGGLVGHHADGTWTVDTLRSPDGDTPAFRSIAVTDEAAFVLSIASPALLYRKPHTDDTWRVVYTNTDSLAFFDSMHFWDNREGIAMGDPLGACLSVIITRDGGATWSEVSCEDLPSAEEAAFAASNGNIALLGDEVWIASGGMASRIFRSPDRGRTWEVVETPIVQGGSMTGMFSVARCDEANGMGWGGNWEAMDDNTANKIATSDGGETWELLTPDGGPGYRSCVQYVPNTDCQSIWAVGIPGISRSSDGGATWTTEPDSNFYTVRFTPDGETAWLAGRGKVANRPVQH